jgi:alpha-amylase/alpha-mannosidase (GH57 family)
MDRYICIHGHFYQPPRENPWLEAVELQDSAYPFHDWNMRITEECYRQNGASRILGSDRKIIDITNNYTNISFNFGPTLLHWLETNAPDVYENIIEADKKSRDLFSGHGSAIAQVYNHMILPLANTRDKHTQVIWGIQDFERHFERTPEGMWLSETAVNTETLEVLAEHGMKFTILAPRQARQIRKIGGKKWTEVKEDTLDTTMPYLCNLPSGKSITLFFYDGKLAHDVAYGGLLHSGENLASRLIESFEDNGQPAQLVQIATDGESFGHHHRHGDMALAYCLHHIRSNNLAKVTVFGEYLEKFPPTHEVQIFENSSWSCAHGVERWKSNCGCCADQSLSGQQQWREPLRRALDWLRDNVSKDYEEKISQFSQDPWQVRNEYIQVINDRSDENVESFIRKVTGRELSYEQKVSFFKLMEMQRMSMLMYTSCGWFFDNISGIETVQIIQYAAHAMQLYEQLTNTNLDGEFVGMLKEAPANVGDLKNGQDIYEAYVKPAQIDLYRVGAHFALSSIFAESSEQEQEVYCYTATMEGYKSVKAGSQILATGKAHIISNISLEKQSVAFTTLHMGGHNLFTALTSPMSDKDFQQIRKNLETSFFKGDTNEVMRQINLKFGGNNYSIWHLFKDEQRRMVYELLTDTWEEIERSFRHIYEQNYSIMLMLRNMNMNLPKALAAPVEFILNQDLCEVVQADEMNIDRLKELTDEAARLSLQLDKETLRYEASVKINNFMEMFEQSRDDVELLSTIESALKILKSIVPDMDMQLAQNLFFTIAKEKYTEMKEKAEAKKDEAATWTELFELVAEHLGLVIE